MESMLDSIVRSLQEGASTAVSKAEDIARLGHARLEIAAAKNRITQLQTELGATVYGQFAAGDKDTGSDEVAELCRGIEAMEEELIEREQEYATLRQELRNAERGDDEEEAADGDSEAEPTATPA